MRIISSIVQLKLYHAVIDDVIAGVRDSFLDEGVDEQVLQEMKQVWTNKLMASKAVELNIDPMEAQPPPIVANNPPKAKVSKVCNRNEPIYLGNWIEVINGITFSQMARSRKLKPKKNNSNNNSTRMHHRRMLMHQPVTINSSLLRVHLSNKLQHNKRRRRNRQRQIQHLQPLSLAWIHRK